jgi:hypothetical protein
MNLLRPGPEWDRGGRRGPATKEAVEEKLRLFWCGSTVTVEEVLEELTRRGWINEREPYGLTAAGEAAHAALARTVEQAGRQIRDGVSAEQYAHTIEVLRHMVENAENLQRSGS